MSRGELRMLTGAECRERALAALRREADCADPEARAGWLEVSQSWLTLGVIADAQDQGEQLIRRLISE